MMQWPNESMTKSQNVPLPLQSPQMILIHATHEAGVKVGGIGAVLDGLLSAPGYLEAVERTILVGPMNTRDPAEMERLLAPRNRVWVRYFSERNMCDCDYFLAEQFSIIERDHGVRLFYGTREFGAGRHEIILVDASEINPQRYNSFKFFVWEHFGLDSARYQSEPEFNLHMAVAEPGFAALQQVLAHVDGGPKTKDGSVSRSPVPRPPSSVILAHEFMGLPLFYAATLAAPGQYKSAFVAHEVATVRPLVEGNAGHDTRFYNVMREAGYVNATLEDVFGDQNGYFKHAMIKTAARCDYVFAVGDLVVEELRFVDRAFRDKRIDLVYNGAPSKRYALEDLRKSSEKLKNYAQILTGLRPAFVFSHVTRMVISKALWRDVRVMEQLDGLLADRGESAVLFVLSSVIPQGRTNAEVQQMHHDYNWPAQHREGWPDLIAFEIDLWRAIEQFNAYARATRIVLINQFGFSRDRCGESMPSDIQFDDLRKGTDLEFGQSIYEPFGIAQIEPLSSGALCVVSNICGCVGFVDRAMNDVTRATVNPQSEIVNPLVVADYTRLPDGTGDAIHIGEYTRDSMERRTSGEVARQIATRLPRNDAQKQALIDTGYALAQRMSWDVVAREQLLPALRS